MAGWCMQRNQNLIYIIKQETKLSRDGMGPVQAVVQIKRLHAWALRKPVHGCIVFLTPLAGGRGLYVHHHRSLRLLVRAVFTSKISLFKLHYLPITSNILPHV